MTGAPFFSKANATKLTSKGAPFYNASYTCKMNDLAQRRIRRVPVRFFASLRHFLGWMGSAFRSHQDLVLENLALRQQLVALHAQRPRRRLTALDKLWLANCYFASHRLTISTYVKDARNLL